MFRGTLTMAKAQKRSARESRKAKTAATGAADRRKGKPPRYLQGTEAMGPGELIDRAAGKK
jgi:hypothetical protein